MSASNRSRSILRSLVAVGCSAVLCLAAMSAAKPPAPAHGAASKEVLARGRYLVTITGCNDCHTPGALYGSPDFSRQLSGSELGWHGPWGVSFPSNLTPDMETGLGYWSEDEIVKAFRTGVKNDGSRVLPPMPWQDFAALSDADAHAIAAYLMSQPAVSHKVPADVPPGQKYDGAMMDFPPPPAWDAPKAPPAAPGK